MAYNQMIIMCNDQVEAVLPYGTTSDQSEEILVRLKMEDKERHMSTQGTARAVEAGTSYDETRYWRVKEVPIVANHKPRLLNTIVIQFPCKVEISNHWEAELFKLVQDVADHHNAIHPAQVMWMFGAGDVTSSEVIRASMMGEPLPGDFGTYHIEFNSREQYAVTEAPTLTHLKAKVRAFIEQLQTHLPEKTNEDGTLNLKEFTTQYQIEDDLFEILYEGYAVGRIDGRGEDISKALARSIMRETSANVEPGSLPMGVYLAMAMLLERMPNKSIVISHADMARSLDKINRIVTDHDNTAHALTISMEEVPEDDDDNTPSIMHDDPQSQPPTE